MDHHDKPYRPGHPVDATWVEHSETTDAAADIHLAVKAAQATRAINGIEVPVRVLNELDWISAVHRARDLAAYEAAAPIREAADERTTMMFRMEEAGMHPDSAWEWACAWTRALLGGIDIDAAFAANRDRWGLIDYGLNPPAANGPMPPVHCHGDAIPCFCGTPGPAYGPVR